MAPPSQGRLTLIPSADHRADRACVVRLGLYSPGMTNRWFTYAKSALEGPAMP